MATHRFSAALAQVADEREGIVTRERLLLLGFEDHDIEDGITRTLLVRVVPGIYSTGRLKLSQQMLRHVAVLGAAPAMLSARGAAEAYGCLDARRGVVNVQTNRRGATRTVRTLIPMEHDGRPGLIKRRYASVVEPVLVGGVEASSVPRTLIDVAASEPRSTLEYVWKQADYRRLLDLAAVDRELRATRRKGAPLVRALFERHPGRFGVPGYYRSPSEVDFRQLVADAGLPDPQVNVPMRFPGRRPYVADFFWEDLGLVAEVDDPSHQRPLARQRDAVRDIDFAAAGLVLIRFDTDRLDIAPAHAMGQLAAIIEQRRRRAA